MFRVIAVLVVVALVTLLVAGVHVLEDEVYWNHYRPPDGDDGCTQLEEGDDHADGE